MILIPYFTEGRITRPFYHSKDYKSVVAARITKLQAELPAMKVDADCWRSLGVNQPDGIIHTQRIMIRQQINSLKALIGLKEVC